MKLYTTCIDSSMQYGTKTTKPQIGWINGPNPASANDITVFRGGTEEEREKEGDREALYWQNLMEA
jgi:hypothetical protein